MHTMRVLYRASRSYGRPMPNTLTSFSTLAAPLLPGNRPWEGDCQVGDRNYRTLLFGDRAYDTYTLDLKSGRMQMQLSLLADGSFLTRHGTDGRWTVSSTAEVALAHAIVRSAVEVERRTSAVRVNGYDNVVEFRPRADRRAAQAAACWLRETTTRALLAATFTFILLALI